MIKQVGVLQWDLTKIADSLNLTVQETRVYFTDGRRVSFILERRICREIIGGRLSPSEGAGFDLIDARGRKWEVRSVTRGGIYFCPSYMVGSGRKFDEGGFLEKLDEIEGYFVSDIAKFPEIPVWKLSADTVRRWYDNQNLGTGTKVSRSRALDLLRALRCSMDSRLLRIGVRRSTNSSASLEDGADTARQRSSATTPAFPSS